MTITEQDRRNHMRKQLELLGLESVVDAIRDALDNLQPSPITVAPDSKQVREFRRMLRLTLSDESDADRDYHLSRAVEIGQQIGYMDNMSINDPMALELCYSGWKLLVRAYGPTPSGGESRNSGGSRSANFLSR